MLSRCNFLSKKIVIQCKEKKWKIGISKIVNTGGM